MHSGVFDSCAMCWSSMTTRRGGAARAKFFRESEQLDPLLRQLRDPDDRAGDLIAFLESLSDDSFDRTVPRQGAERLETRRGTSSRPGGSVSAGC